MNPHALEHRPVIVHPPHPHPLPPAGPRSIPEPSAALFLGVAAALLLRRASGH